MKVIIEPESSPPVWHYSQTEDLSIRIYANEPFQTWDGQMVPAGSPYQNSRAWLEVPVELNGLSYGHQAFEIDSTEDSPTHPDARYSAYVFSGDLMLFPKLLGFPVRAVVNPGDPSLTLNLTWTMLEQHRDALRAAYPYNEGLWPVGTVDYKIAQALAFLRLASATQYGMVALDYPAIDPAYPEAVGANSPRVAREVGRDGVLVAEEATTILSAAVRADSLIIPVPVDGSINGRLRAFNVIEGLSFDVASDHGGDEGIFGWVIF